MQKVLVDTNVVLRYLLRDIAEQLFATLNRIEVERPEIMFRAVKIFAETHLGFVDCILAAHHGVNGTEVFTFDKKLANQLKREETL